MSTKIFFTPFLIVKMKLLISYYWYSPTYMTLRRLLTDTVAVPTWKGGGVPMRVQKNVEKGLISDQKLRCRRLWESLFFSLLPSTVLRKRVTFELSYARPWKTTHFTCFFKRAWCPPFNGSLPPGPPPPPPPPPGCRIGTTIQSELWAEAFAFWTSNSIIYLCIKT